jgi:hypothetical protein
LKPTVKAGWASQKPPTFAAVSND